MVTTLELQPRGLRYAVSVDAAATNASLLDLQQKGLPYAVEVADGATMASRAALDARGLRYFVPVLVDATPASKASLAAQGLSYAVKVDADILPADRLTLDRQGLRYFAAVDSSGNSVAAGAGGGADIITSETDGFATDFTFATDASRVAVKTAGVVVSSGLDAFYSNAGTSPKQVFDVTGALVWSPHNMFLNSGVPATQSVSTVVGFTYTVTVVGTGSLTGSNGASGVATAGSPRTFTATGVTSTFTLAGSLTRIQMNRGTLATAYIATTAAIRIGLAVDYDPATHVARGLLLEASATNLLVNNSTLSTQSVTVSATAYTLSFLGTGTVTLSGVSTAGPLVGTGASNRVTLTFTPTAGSLTLTVTGTVSNAQLETGTFATSVIYTASAAASRGADNPTFLLSAIPALGSAYSIYCRFATPLITNARSPVVLTDGTFAEFVGFVANTTARLTVQDNSVAVGAITGPTLVANTAASAAARIKLNDCAMSVAGGAAAFDTTVTLPTVTEVRFGGQGNNGSASAVFSIEKLIIVPRAWSDAELAAKSAT